MSDKIKNGDIISIKYTGTFDDGVEFDKTDDKSPLYFKVGDGEILPKFEEAVIGLTIGDNRQITLEAKDAYGQRDENKLIPAKTSDFSSFDEIFEGMSFYYNDPTGEPAYAYIEKIDGEDVIVNFNHPLAGKTLHFDFTILSINDINEEQLNDLYSQYNANGCGGCGGDCSCDDNEGGCGGCGGCCH